MKCRIWLVSNRFRLRGGYEGKILMNVDRKAVAVCKVILGILLKRQRHVSLGFSVSHIRPHLTLLLWVRVRL
jgi:hypothetical protein